MFWPKNKIRYENLKSSFVNLKFLVEDLKKSGFDGFLEVGFGMEAYYILMKKGTPVRIYLKDETGKFSYESIKVDEVYRKSLGKLALINVYEVEPGKIETLVAYLNAEPLYANLSSEFTDFGRLTNKLSKDRLNGYLEVKFTDSSVEPLYFLYQKGKIQDVFRDEKSLGKDAANIETIKKELESHEAYFSVFESSKKAAEETPNIRQGKVQSQEETNVDEIHNVETETLEMVENEYGSEGEGEEGKEESEDMEEIEEIDIQPEPHTTPRPEPQKKPAESVEAKHGDTGEAGAQMTPVSEPTIDKKENGAEDLPIVPYLGFAEALIQWVEKSVDRHMGADYFSKAFKKGLLNISDKYPFLDPFLAEFTYNDGRIRFTESDVKAIEFFKGIHEAINMIFEELSEKRRNDIRKTLKSNLRDLEKRFHEEIEILRLRTLMPVLFH